MTNNAFTDAIAEAYATARTDVVYFDTLEITSAATPPLFLVNDRVDQTLRLETGVWQLFTSTGFAFTLPASGQNGLQDLTITIDNVDRRPSDFIKAVVASNQPVQITYRPYLSSDLATPQMNPPLVLFLTDVQITSVQVSGTATFADILNRSFLSQNYTRRRFPSLA